MKCARDAMTTDVLTVSKETDVRDLARMLVDREALGACVIEDGKLVGIVTEMDVVFREKRVHLPTVITFLEAVLTIDPGGRTQHEFEKIAGRNVAEIMTTHVKTVGPDTPLADVATVMVDDHVSIVPVLDDGRLIGAITRRTIMQALLD